MKKIKSSDDERNACSRDLSVCACGTANDDGTNNV